MKKSNRMTNVVCVVVGLLLVLFIIGSVKDLVFGPETPTDLRCLAEQGQSSFRRLVRAFESSDATCVCPDGICET